MAYRTVLLHLDPAQDSDTAAQAQALAAAFDAQLVVLTVLSPLTIPVTAPTEAVIDLLSEQWESDRVRLAAAAEDFVATARASGMSRVEARFAVGQPERVVAVHGRYADVIVTAQAALADGGIAEALVLNAGRPVLVVPRRYEHRPIGRRVLIAWNASREATRAVTDALPLLCRAASVDVVTVNAELRGDGHGELPGADIALYLARHGVPANVLPTVSIDIDVGAWLLSRAADLGSDLIVMGAYGHSRFRELVLGGATRSMLQSMTVPVLMSH